MARKSVVFFTFGYPYGPGEEFLGPEMKRAESQFEKILIVTCDKKSNKITKYVPENASLFNVRDRVSSRRLFFIRLLSLFSPAAWRQILICLREKGFKGLRGGIKAVVLAKSLIMLLQRYEENWAGKYDLYYSYWLAGAAAYIALTKEKLGGILISRAHGYDCFSDRGFHPFRQKQLDAIDHIFPISDAGKEDLIAQGCDPKKIKVARLGVEKPDDKVNPYKANEIKRIVTCSNIVDLKRLDLLIGALNIISDVNIEWIHFGDGVLREEIEKLAAQKLTAKKNIRYSFKGRVQLKQIFDYYGSVSIDCFINCSDMEGIPVSIMEAMSYGIPCVARDVGGNNEIVANGKNGFLLPTVCSAEELAEAIILLLSLQSEAFMKMRDEAANTYHCDYYAEGTYNRFWDFIIEKCLD